MLSHFIGWHLLHVVYNILNMQRYAFSAAGQTCSYSSVASWAVFPHNTAVFFVALRDIFFCCGLRFFGLFSFIKVHAVFWAVFVKDFSIKSIIFVNGEVCFDLK